MSQSLCSGRNDSNSSSFQTWSLQKMKIKYLFFTYILKVSNKMYFRKKYGYRYWKILQYLTGYWYWPQYFSTLSIDIDTAVHFKYRYSLLFLGIGKNMVHISSMYWNVCIWLSNIWSSLYLVQIDITYGCKMRVL